MVRFLETLKPKANNFYQNWIRPLSAPDFRQRGVINTLRQDFINPAKETMQSIGWQLMMRGAVGAGGPGSTGGAGMPPLPPPRTTLRAPIIPQPNKKIESLISKALGYQVSKGIIAGAAAAGVLLGITPLAGLSGLGSLMLVAGAVVSLVYRLGWVPLKQRQQWSAINKELNSQEKIEATAYHLSKLDSKQRDRVMEHLQPNIREAMKAQMDVVKQRAALDLLTRKTFPATKDGLEEAKKEQKNLADHMEYFTGSIAEDVRRDAVAINQDLLGWIQRVEIQLAREALAASQSTEFDQLERKTRAYMFDQAGLDSAKIDQGALTNNLLDQNYYATDALRARAESIKTELASFIVRLERGVAQERAIKDQRSVLDALKTKIYPTTQEGLDEANKDKRILDVSLANPDHFATAELRTEATSIRAVVMQTIDDISSHLRAAKAAAPAIAVPVSTSTTPVPTAPVPDFIGVGSYKLIKFIKSGGMGKTYKAQNIGNGKIVVIKTMDIKELVEKDRQIGLDERDIKLDIISRAARFYDEYEIPFTLDKNNLPSICKSLDTNLEDKDILPIAEWRELIKQENQLVKLKAKRSPTTEEKNEMQLLEQLVERQLASIDLAIIEHKKVFIAQEFVAETPGSEIAAKELGAFYDKDAPKLDADNLKDQFTSVLQALGHAHLYGKSHRDLKPANLLVTKTSRGILIKIVDWGIAKNPERSGLTRFDSSVGTPWYTAPEKYHEDGKDDSTIYCKIDVYSMGVIFYELLTKKLPFPELDDSAWTRFRLSPKPISQEALDKIIDTRLRPIIARMLSTKHEDNFESMNEVLAALGWPQNPNTMTAASLASRMVTPPTGTRTKSLVGPDAEAIKAATVASIPGGSHLALSAPIKSFIQAVEEKKNDTAELENLLNPVALTSIPVASNVEAAAVLSFINRLQGEVTELAALDWLGQANIYFTQKMIQIQRRK